MKETIRHFMAADGIAVVGASDGRNKFGGTIFRELKKRGRTVYPVHPTATTVCGERCYQSVGDLPAGVETVVIVVKPEKALAVVEAAASRGIKRLWFQQGADFSEAVRRAEELELDTVSGKCILMYVSPVTGLHRFHQGLARLFGRY